MGSSIDLKNILGSAIIKSSQVLDEKIDTTFISV